VLDPFYGHTLGHRTGPGIVTGTVEPDGTAFDYTGSDKSSSWIADFEAMYDGIGMLEANFTGGVYNGVFYNLTALNPANEYRKFLYDVTQRLRGEELPGAPVAGQVYLPAANANGWAALYLNVIAIDVAFDAGVDWENDYPYLFFNVAPGAPVVVNYEAIVVLASAALDIRYTNDVYLQARELATFYPKRLSLDVVVDDKTIIRKAAFDNMPWRENLLTVGGLSHFLPERIFKSYLQYPALIQDFDLGIDQSSIVKYRDFSRDLSGCVVELTPKTGFTIHTYTRNQFDQNDKSLQSMDWDVPLIERFQKEFAKEDDGRYEVAFETSNGRPSKVFIYIERVGGTTDPYSDMNPVIKGVELECIGQSISSLDVLDEYQIYECTRRNAALRADLIKLHQQTGGCMLGLEDVCNWKDFDVFGSRDTFKGSLVVTEQDIGSVDTTAIEDLTTGEFAELYKQPRRITVLFVYEVYCLRGAASTLEFWKRDYSNKGSNEKKAYMI
jgi:hypothetical protein